MPAVTLRAAPLLLFLLLSLPAQANEKKEVFFPRRAEIAPFKREVPLGKPLTLKVKLKRGFKAPVFSITNPKGETRYLHSIREFEGWHIFEIDFENRKGAYRIELVVDSKRGDTTAAQFTLWAGVPKSAPAAVTPGRSDKKYEPDTAHLLMVERKLFRHINDFRRQQGKKPYPWLEKAAHLGRDHMRDYLKIRPRPKKLTHLIPSFGSIADRFEDFYAWPQTIRKFPVAEPDIGPEATCFCSESLAQFKSVDWLFNEYYLKESAFRAPVLSEYPTHAAVGMVRDKKTGRIYAATVYVQVNSTRVRKEMEQEFDETNKLEGTEKDPVKRAEFLRRLGRRGDRRSLPVFVRRLAMKSLDQAVRGAALDALYLNDPEYAEKWVERHRKALERARENEDYRRALHYLLAMSALKWNEKVKGPADRELRFITRLAGYELDAALAKLEAGKRGEATDQLASVAQRFPGIPAGIEAKAKLKELEGE